MATNIKDIPVDSVTVPPSHRKPAESKVASLADSIRRKKRMLQPIMVRKHRDTNILVFGGHRLAAAKCLGWETIPAIFADGMSELECELAEIDENIERAALTIMEESIALARRKSIYLSLYPETAQGVAGGKATHPTQRNESTTDTVSVVAPSFASDTAAKTGKSERTVERRVAAGKTLSPKAAEILRETPAANSQTQMEALAELPKKQQVEVAKAVASGESTSVQAAIAATTPEPSVNGDGDSDDDGCIVEFTNACNSGKIKATKEQRAKFKEFDEDSQLAFVTAIVNGWQSLPNALSTGEVAEPPISHKIKEHNAAVDSDCKMIRASVDALQKLFADIMDKPHNNTPWADEGKRKETAIQKFANMLIVDKLEGLLQTIRSWKLSAACPKCEGAGCSTCHKTGMVVKNVIQQNT